LKSKGGKEERKRYRGKGWKVRRTPRAKILATALPTFKVVVPRYLNCLPRLYCLNGTKFGHLIL